MEELFTIGYSSFKIVEFINLLKKYNINSLIDVRSNPNSKFYVEYNEAYLKPILTDNNIIYRNYKIEFGARQSDQHYFTNGYLDFKKYTASDSFLSGIQKIRNGINNGYTFAFMCAEQDPSECHRSIMITRKLSDLGYLINHILKDGTFATQQDIENTLVNTYFPNQDQISLFEPNYTWDEMVERSYALKNSEIGYRINLPEERSLMYG